MATSKKTPAATTKKTAAKAAGAPVTMGGAVVGRPQAKPMPGAGKVGPSGTANQVDPLFLYDINVFTGTAWLVVGEIWFDTSGNEYWGLFQSWATYNVGPNLWIYPTAYATTVANLKAFKTKVNLADPNHNSSFIQLTSTPV